MPRTSRKVAIVVGATGVLGALIVHSFLKKGMQVVAIGRSTPKLAALRSGLPAEREALLLPLTVDVRDSSAVEDIVQTIESRVGIPHLLVYAVGTYGAVGDVVSVPLDSWRCALETNTFGAYNCLHSVVPRMVSAGRGRILNIAGGGASGPLEHLTSYGISKVAIARLSDSLANELAGTEITVNAILPGPFDSPMQNDLLEAGGRAGHWHARITAMRNGGESGKALKRTLALIDFLFFGIGRHFSGKLLSAQHDPFDKWSDEDVKRIAGSPLYTLRRVDPMTMAMAVDGYKP